MSSFEKVNGVVSIPAVPVFPQKRLAVNSCPAYSYAHRTVLLCNRQNRKKKKYQDDEFNKRLLGHKPSTSINGAIFIGLKDLLNENAND